MVSLLQRLSAAAQRVHVVQVGVREGFAGPWRCSHRLRNRNPMAGQIQVRFVLLQRSASEVS